MKEKINKFILGTRIKPWFFDCSRMHFISLKKYVLYFTEKYIKDNDKVLDFWCWNWPYKNIYKNKKIDYVWIDIWNSPEFNKNYIVYKWWKTPFKNEEFNIVVSTQVFEHLKDPFFYANELERITKKNWYLLITIAHIWEYHPYPNHYFNIMKCSIPEMFKNCEIIDVKWDTSEIQNIFMFFMKYIWKIRVIWPIIIMIINFYFEFLNKIWLHKIWPQEYNKMTWNILIILKKNNAKNINNNNNI